MTTVRAYIRKDVAKGLSSIHFERLDDCWTFLILGVTSQSESDELNDSQVQQLYGEQWGVIAGLVNKEDRNSQTPSYLVNPRYYGPLLRSINNPLRDNNTISPVAYQLSSTIFRAVKYDNTTSRGTIVDFLLNLWMGAPALRAPDTQHRTFAEGLTKAFWLIIDLLNIGSQLPLSNVRWKSKSPLHNFLFGAQIQLWWMFDCQLNSRPPVSNEDHQCHPSRIIFPWRRRRGWYGESVGIGDVFEALLVVSTYVRWDIHRTTTDKRVISSSTRYRTARNASSLPDWLDQATFQAYPNTDINCTSDGYAREPSCWGMFLSSYAR